jgi:serine/threonine-protein kinase HipA
MNVRQQVDVCLGKAGTAIGSLTYVRQGARENTAFRYADAWLADPEAFKISPDLDLIPAHQQRKAASKVDSPFAFALADTAPDAWGRRVIARDHAKRRQAQTLQPAQSVQPVPAALNEMDYLLAVDDFSRVGALRLREQSGNDATDKDSPRYFKTVQDGLRSTPPLVDLLRMYEASRAVERGDESRADLAYLQGKGTSLGGMRPKCTVIDTNGRLAIGKFPSVDDARSVTRGEVLAMRLAQFAGITVAASRIELIDGVPVAVIERFDRTADFGRIPYLSAASLLQASREHEHSYFDIADAIRANGAMPAADVQQLWRRIAFNLLITNVDDHLQNHGFLHVAKGQWRLAPAFDINPFPDKAQESKTWLSELDGPVDDVRILLARAPYFGLSPAAARQVLAEVCKAIQQWRSMAVDKQVGLTARELNDFAPAFEHGQMEMAWGILRG